MMGGAMSGMVGGGAWPTANGRLEVAVKTDWWTAAANMTSLVSLSTSNRVQSINWIDRLSMLARVSMVQQDRPLVMGYRGVSSG